MTKEATNPRDFCYLNAVSWPNSSCIFVFFSLANVVEHNPRIPQRIRYKPHRHSSGASFVTATKMMLETSQMAWVLVSAAFALEKECLQQQSTLLISYDACAEHERNRVCRRSHRNAGGERRGAEPPAQQQQP